MAKKDKEGGKVTPPESTTRGTLEQDLGRKRIPAVFFRTESGNEPVRDWLKAMPREDRRLVGEDIKTVEFGWPIGMPTGKSIGEGLHEVRTNLAGNRIVRIFFYVDRMGRMVLLHGIAKKTRRTPEDDLKLALQNKRKHERELK
jgi:phage-related protein